MSRWMVVGPVLVLTALALIAYAVTSTLAAERATAVARDAEDERRQLEWAADALRDDLVDVAEDLRFATHLAERAKSPDELERELRSLLGAIGPYRAVHIYGPSGELRVAVRSPGLEAAPLDAIERELRAIASNVQARAPGEIENSATLAGDPTGMLRAFGTRLPGEQGAMVLVVDVSALAGRLTILSGPSTDLLVIGRRGVLLPVGDAHPDRAAVAYVESLGRQVPYGETRVQHVDRADVRRLGLGSDEIVVAVRRITLPGAGFWTVATVSDTVALRAHLDALASRALTGAVAAIVCVVVFAAYALVTTRRDAALRERLRHADAMAHLQEKTEKILDNVPAAVMTLADDGRVTAVNRAFVGWHGHRPLGADLASALPRAAAADVRRLAELTREARARGTITHLLDQRLQLFGEEGRYSVHAVPLDQRFAEARLLVVIDDMNAVGELQDRLLLAEKHATVGVLAAGIAHEIGTPLGVARARAELIVDQVGEGPLARSAELIVQQVDSVSRTIRQLLDFSRASTPTVEPVEVGAVVGGVCQLLELEVQRRGITLACDVPAEVPPIAADPDQVEQVLVNLVMNASDACGEGGVVTIKARTQPGTRSPRVCVQVIDTGPGVPPELRHRVFDPFFTTKKRGAGTGLGLSLAAQVVRSHGGSITLDSESGRGTCVSTLWPTAAPSPMEAAGADG